ncbi:cyclic nucleotide-binding-like protein [Dunaliella salina]|uniref:Cyclic nucleotide-binding-like protein n=1 Tax=Dunaliella salina TaxID=3046 RepID=A0ABQ7GQX7_DUNSA|nr:cyclic nucleotide-binding-like protein [Dunaliella salina]|eukprot:KAF5836998.1 cyclic nucleotide-binding-like protein [Dunaliella salina]
MSNMDPMMDASLSGAFSGSGAMAAGAGMSGPYAPEPSSASWYGPTPMQAPPMLPQLSSLSGSSFAQATPMGTTAAAAAAAAGSSRASFASSTGTMQTIRNSSLSTAPATANGTQPIGPKHSHSSSAFSAVQQQQQQQQHTSQALANSIIFNESVALKRTLEVEVEQQQQLRASMQGVRSIYPYCPCKPSPQKLPERGEVANGPLKSWYNRSSNGSGKAGGMGQQTLAGSTPIYFSLEASTSSSFLFRGLGGPEKVAVFQAFQQVPIKAGQLVIRQGGPGDHFYVVQSGIFDVYLQQEPGQTPLLVHSYEAAEASLPSGSTMPYFGELALLYRRPGPASVVARTDGALWSLHRNDFKACLQQGVRPSDGRDVAALVSTLQKVEVLRCLTGTQLRALAEAMEEHW